MISKMLEDFSISASVLGISSLSALILGCLFLFLACACILQKKALRSTFYGALGLLCLSGLATVLLVGLNIHSYQRLSYESKIGLIHFVALAPQRYSASIVQAGSETEQKFELRGDEWQLGTRVIRWQAPLTLLGLDSLYRLERLQGRYEDIQQERFAPRSVNAFHSDNNLDFAVVIGRYQRWLPWIDTTYGNAVYMPMADKASYTISMSQSGLVARPDNKAAEIALANWR